MAAGTWAGCRGRFLVVGMSVCPFVVWVVNGCVVSLRGWSAEGLQRATGHLDACLLGKKNERETRARAVRSVDRSTSPRAKQQAGRQGGRVLNGVRARGCGGKEKPKARKEKTHTEQRKCMPRLERGERSTIELGANVEGGSTGFLVVCRSRVSGLVCAPPRFTSQGGPRTATQACRPGAGLLFSGRLGLAVVGEPSKSTKLGAPAARSQHTLRPAPPPPKNTRTHALAVAVRPGYSLVFFIRVGRGGVLRLRPSALRPLRHCLDLKPADS